MENNTILQYILESNLINFVIAVVLLIVFLTKFLPESTQQRRKELEAEINAAENAKRAAEEKLKELENEIEKAKQESKQIIQNAENSGEKIKSDILEQAKAEIRKLSDLASQEIDLQRNTAMESLRKEIAHKVYELTEKALVEKSANLDKAITNKTMRDIAEAK